MEYVINWGWLIALAVLPFLAGIMIGVTYAREKMTMKILKKLDVDEIKKLLETGDKI